MSSSRIFISCGFLALSSCAWNDLSVGEDGFRRDHGCANIVESHAGATGSALDNWSDLTKLMSRNRVAFDNLRFTEYDDKDPLNNQTRTFVHVRADQFVNGLPVFRSSVGFHFLNRELYFTMGHRYEAGIPTLDTERRLDTSIIRALYFSEMKNYNVSAKTFRVNCLDMQFGYLDLNAGNSMLKPGNLVKAWFVKPSDGEYPEAIFLDDDGSTRSFFDGRYY